MIATQRFVFLRPHKTGGQFIHRQLNHLADARTIAYPAYPCSDRESATPAYFLEQIHQQATQHRQDQI